MKKYLKIIIPVVVAMVVAVVAIVALTGKTNKANTVADAKAAYSEFFSDENWAGFIPTDDAEKKMAVVDIGNDGVPEVFAYYCNKEKTEHTAIFLSYKKGQIVVNSSHEPGVWNDDRSYATLVNENDGTFMAERFKGKNIQSCYSTLDDGRIEFNKNYACFSFDKAENKKAAEEYNKIAGKMKKLEYVTVDVSNLAKYF